MRKNFLEQFLPWIALFVMRESKLQNKFFDSNLKILQFIRRAPRTIIENHAISRNGKDKKRTRRRKERERTRMKEKRKREIRQDGKGEQGRPLVVHTFSKGFSVSKMGP